MLITELGPQQAYRAIDYVVLPDARVQLTALRSTGRRRGPATATGTATPTAPGRRGACRTAT